MKISELENHIAEILDLNIPDVAYNGLQVANSAPIKKLITAVDFSEELLVKAIKEKADAIMVHHGMFWGNPLPLVGRHYRLTKGLLINNIALLAYHLPLDIHFELGNNALLLRELGAEYQESFGNYKGVSVIFSGRIKPVGWKEFLDRFKKKIGNPITVVTPKDNTLIKKIGVCSGGGLFGVEDAHKYGCDVYITGDAGHTAYHPAKELGIRLICGGHYSTEIWGVKALGKKIGEELGLSVKFIDIPTGL